ncbi:MAG: hypothetical protein OQK81_04420 [Candidatus Bathyarchaeota archaeon]|nr:hypothetical protein [Candidatus Bathyarchaeota archaeon]
MKHYAVLVLVINLVLFLLFVLTTFHQVEMFNQEHHSSNILTRVNWGITSITIQNYYLHTDGTVSPAAGFSIYPNFPFMVGVFFMVVNTILVLSFFRWKWESNK